MSKNEKNNSKSSNFPSLPIIDEPRLHQDENDSLQCGKCKQIFKSVSSFLIHKEQHKTSDLNNIDLNANIWYENILTDTNGKLLPLVPDDINSELIDNNLLLDNTDLVWSNCKELISTFQNSPIIGEERCSTPFNLSNITEDNEPVKEPAPCTTVRTVYKCNECKKEFDQESDLVQHYKIHMLSRDFQCAICGRTFAQKSNQCKHIKTHQTWPHDVNFLIPKYHRGDYVYVCMFCKKIFKTSHELKKHANSKHSNLKVFKCALPTCDAMFDSETNLLHHMHDLHPDRTFACHICCQSSNSLKDAAEHLKIHTQSSTDEIDVRNIRYTCLVCNCSFSTQQGLQKHQQTATHKHECHICNKTFNDARYLRRHIKIHKGTPHSCQICGRVFQLKTSLSNHMLIHNTVPEFTCMHCSMTFKRKDHLIRHIVTHQSKKVYECPLKKIIGCNMSFHRKDKLQRHFSTHCKVKRKREIAKTVSIVVCQIDPGNIDSDNLEITCLASPENAN